MEGLWNHLKGTWRETLVEGSDDGRNKQRDDNCIYEQQGKCLSRVETLMAYSASTATTHDI